MICRICGEWLEYHEGTPFCYTRLSWQYVRWLYRKVLDFVAVM